MPGPTKTVIAHHAYEPARDDELALAAGDRIEVTDSSDPDWWIGTKDDGTSGYFPSNFVEPANEESGQASAEGPSEKESNQETQDPDDNSSKSESAPVQAIGMARVMEDYAMQSPDELTLHRGNIVTLYERLEDGWLKGELNGKVGRFPSQYVEDIDMPGRPDLGLPLSGGPKGANEEGETREGPSFKLAAYGVKQGGIGSVLAAGFKTLKKTSVPKKQQPAEEQSKDDAPEPTVRAAKDTTEASEKSAQKVESESPQEAQQPVQDSASSPSTETYVAKAIVLHPYDAENEDELNLLRGEYIHVLDKNADDGWWKGVNERGETGVFPSNFVKEIEEQIAPPTPVRSRKSVTSAGSQQSVISSAVPGTGPRLPPLPNKATRPASESSSSSTAMPGTGPRVPALPNKATRPVSEASGLPSSAHHQQQQQPVFSPAKESPAPIQEEPVENTDEDKPATEKEPEPASASSSPKETQNEPHIESTPTTPQSIASPPSIPSRPIVSKQDPDVSRPTESSPSTETETEKDESSQDKAAEIEEVSAETSDVVEKESEEPKAPTQEKDEKEQSETTGDQESASQDPVDKTAEADSQDADEKQSEGKEADSPSEAAPVAEVEEKKPLELLPSGPKLSLPSRARPGRPRRAPELTKDEPSQTELLEKEIAQQPVDTDETSKSPEKPEKPSLPPTKPIKPIFAKFPTPFGAGSAEEISTKNLKPVQRRMWEPAPAHEPKEEVKKAEEEQPTAPRPAGVRNIASRFNIPTAGGNDVMETKLKNFTKNEVDKLRKDFEQQLREEREKREQLEALVASLEEKIGKLTAQLQ